VTEPDLPAWRERVKDGTIARLKNGGRYDAARFLGTFCWSPATRQFVPVGAGGVVGDPAAWQRDLEAGAARAPCLAGTLRGSR
jgi:hypothetical protein